MEDFKMKDNFIEQLNKLKKLYCLFVITGEEAMSSLFISFDNELIVDPLSDVSKVSDLAREYDSESEYGLFIRDGIWRLETSSDILTGGHQVDRGKMLFQLKKLQGTKVTNIHLCKLSCDLEIEFDYTYKLKIFTIFIDEDSDYEEENYMFSTDKETYCIVSSGELNFEQ